MKDREEQFFIFRDRMPVTAANFRSMLHNTIKLSGLDHTLYRSHGMTAG